jgi:hypothetical protein
MATPQPRQPFENVRRRGEADNRRTRPTVSEQYIKESKQGSSDYRGIDPNKTQRKKAARLSNKTETQTGVPANTNQPPVYGPVKNLKYSPIQTGRSVMKRVKSARSSWMMATVCAPFYLLSVAMAIISLIGIGIAVAGGTVASDLLGWIPFGLGDWAEENAAAPGILIFQVFHIIAVTIQILILLFIAIGYLLQNVKWYPYWQCHVTFIFAIFCSLTPVLNLLPATLLFMLSVIRYTK